MAEREVAFIKQATLSAAIGLGKGISVLRQFLSTGALATAVAAGGTGYRVGDVLTLVGGTVINGIKAKIIVRSVDPVTGAVLTFDIADNGKAAGVYTTKPGNAVATTGGSGSGCTLTAAWLDDNVPLEATHARVQVAAQNIRCRADGTAPDSTTGELILVKAAGVPDRTFYGGEMRSVQMIEVAASASVGVMFYKG